MSFTPSPNTIAIDIMPTIFPEHNAKMKLSHDHLTTSLAVSRLKHGHIRNMQRLTEEEQIHFLMSQLTGLSQNDLDELDIEDSAKLSEVIINFLHGYAKIAKGMTQQA